jgi:hypothetical protein
VAPHETFGSYLRDAVHEDCAYAVAFFLTQRAYARFVLLIFIGGFRVVFLVISSFRSFY